MRIKDDDFDVVAKKYIKLKSVSMENGIFKDEDNNLVLIIKKEGISKQGFGIDLLKDNEGSDDWAKEVLLKASIINPINFRIIIIYHNPNISGESYDMPNYNWSEYKNDVWKYIGSHEYREKEKITIIKSAIKNINKQQELKYSRVLAIYRKKDPKYPTKIYLENILEKEFVDILDAYKRKIDYYWFLNMRLSFLSSQCENYSFISYYLNQNIKNLIDGLNTTFRLKYLTYIASPQKHSDHLPYFIYAVAINDEELIKAYLSNIPGPFDDEFNKVWKIMTKCIYSIFNENKDQEEINSIKKEITRLLELKSVQQYIKSFLKCFDDIISHDYNNFSEHLDQVLISNSKVDDFYNPIDWTSLYALAFYNMAYFDKDRKTGMPPEPEYSLWNSELWHEIIKDDQKREYVIDIEKVSPVLKKWIDELPEKIDFEELVESLK